MFIACVGSRPWAAVGEAQVHVHARTKEICGSKIKQKLKAQLNLRQFQHTQMELQDERMLSG